MIFILYQKIRTLPKNSYFTEIFVLDGKFRTPDVQVLCHCVNRKSLYLRHINSLLANSNTFSVGIFSSQCKLEKYFSVTAS